MLYIGVIGAGEADKKTEDTAYEVGRLIAKTGATLICGGLGGVMNAAARGVSEEGGIAVGILPASSRIGASEYLTLSIPTGLGEARNALIATASNALIAISGEYGTLSEIGLSLKMGKPVIGLDTWQLSKVDGKIRAIRDASSPEEAVNLAIQAAKAARV